MIDNLNFYSTQLYEKEKGLLVLIWYISVSDLKRKKKLYSNVVANNVSRNSLLAVPACHHIIRYFLTLLKIITKSKVTWSNDCFRVVIDAERRKDARPVHVQNKGPIISCSRMVGIRGGSFAPTHHGPYL